MRVKILISAALVALAACGNGQSGGPAEQGEAQALRAAADDPRLQRFYEARAWQPAWQGEAGERLAEAIGGASRHGLDPAAFLRDIPEGGDAAARDAALSRAALDYAEALARGRTDPTRLDRAYTLPRPDPDLVGGLAGAIDGGDVSGWLESLAPQDAEYRALSEAYAQANRQIGESAGNPPPQLVNRARTLAVNLERRRWLERAPPATRIVVNTAPAMLTYFRDGSPVDRRRVVVGEPGNETPELASPLYRLVANPTWTVPRSIEEEEIAPQGESYLRRNNMVRRDGWITTNSACSGGSIGLMVYSPVLMAVKIGSTIRIAASISSRALRPSIGLTEPQKTARSGCFEAISAHFSHGDSPSWNRSVSGSGCAAIMSVSEPSMTIS